MGKEEKSDERNDNRQNEKQERTNAVENELERLTFYHGVIPKEEAARMMDNSVCGSYLIKSSLQKGNVTLGLTLSVRISEAGDAEKSCHHYGIHKKEDGYILKQDFMDSNGSPKVIYSKPFPKITDLIEYYTEHRLGCRIRLYMPVRREHWKLRHSQVLFDESGRLGSGNFCVVYKGMLKDMRADKEMKATAIKVSKDTERNSEILMETRNLLMAEARIMMNYHHANVVYLYGVACDKPPFMVCMEFCPGGSLEDALKKYGKNMEDFEKQMLLLDAARGIRYLHSQNCVHRDLASRNCLISSEGIVKIADFGLSKTLKKGHSTLKEALKEAPLAWLAPECIQRESEFSNKTDVWAFGVVMYEVYNNGDKLFAGEEDATILRRIRKAKMPTIENCTKVTAMQNILNTIWVQKPEQRPEMQKIVEMLIAAFPSQIKDEDLKRIQINKLKDVKRTKLACTEVEDPLIMEIERPQMKDTDSEKKRRKFEQRRRKKLSSKRRKSRTKKDDSNKTQLLALKTTRTQKSEE